MSVLRRGALEHLTPPKHWRSRAITFEKPAHPPGKGGALRVLLGQLVVCAYTAWPLVVCAWRTEIRVTPSSWQSQQSEKERSFVCELSATYLFH